MRGYCLLACALLCAFLPDTAAGAGLFEDFGESSSFILSPRVPSLSAAVARTEDEGRDAFLYSLFASYPIQSVLLLQFEQSYITVSYPRGIESGFGDFRLRLRARFYSTPGRVLYFTSALRSGTGSRRVFPFSSGSVDATIGFALVDTLSLFNYWGTAGVSAVWRGPEEYDENSRHDDYAIISGGVSFPILDSFDIRFFGAGYFLFSGPRREIYGMHASFRASPSVSVFASLQAEGGDKDTRVTDVAAVAGACIYY